jgi:hypothetical protein
MKVVHLMVEEHIDADNAEVFILTGCKEEKRSIACSERVFSFRIVKAMDM